MTLPDAQIFTLERHPISARYPEKPDAIERIKADMRIYGYRSDKPIILYGGKIIDGWHRFKAAKSLGIIPAFKEFEGTKAEAQIMIRRENLARRNMNAIQVLFCLFQEMYDDPSFEATPEELAKQVGCSVQYVKTGRNKFEQATVIERAEVISKERDSTQIGEVKVRMPFLLRVTKKNLGLLQEYMTLTQDTAQTRNLNKALGKGLQLMIEETSVNT